MGKLIQVRIRTRDPWTNLGQGNHVHYVCVCVCVCGPMHIHYWTRGISTTRTGTVSTILPPGGCSNSALQGFITLRRY